MSDKKRNFRRNPKKLYIRIKKTEKEELNITKNFKTSNNEKISLKNIERFLNDEEI